MTVRVELLGTPHVVLSGGEVIGLRPTTRDQALVYLAHAGVPVNRDQLGFLFWADQPDATMRHNVRQLLKRMRRLPWLEEIGPMETTGDAVRWSVRTDVQMQREAAAGGRWGPPLGGDFLDGFERNATVEFETWLLSERERVRDELRGHTLEASAAAERAGSTARAAEVLRALLDDDRAHEILARYMELAVRAGQRGAAMAAFERVSAHLHDALGVEPPVRAAQLMDRLRARGDEEAGAGEGFAVGRADELQEIAGLLAQPECRLLTLLGPGGIGKSTLAARLIDTFAWRNADGAALVSLEAVDDPDTIPSQIAMTLGVPLDARLDAAGQLEAALRNRELLLILDNMEHLPAGWPAISRLLPACPRLSIVVTSRERLRLAEEWVYEVRGLRDADGVALVQRRARRVAPDLEVTPDDALAICRTVGGSPLAIELAVPWLRVMSPSEVVAEVGRDTAILSGGGPDALARHRSMDAAMAHSWALISDEEREAVEALSVFAAPYSRELASEVARATPITLGALIDKSLVQRRPDGRFASHPLVRQYAASRLAAADERRSAVRDRHANAVLSMLDPPRSEPTREHLLLLDDAVVAWRRSVEAAHWGLLCRSAEGLVSLLDAAGRFRLGLQLLSEAQGALDGAQDHGSSRAGALRAGEGHLLYRLGRRQEAAAAAREVAAAARATGDQRLLALALLTLGWALKWIEGDEAQYATIREALPVTASIGDAGLSARIRSGLGCSAPSLEECREHLLRGLADTAAAQLPRIRARLLNNLGSVVWGLGETAAAIGYLQESLDLARPIQATHTVIESLADLAFVHGQAGNLDAAGRLIAEAEELCRGTELVDSLVYVSLVAGEIRRARGDVRGARERALEALRLCHADGQHAFTLRALRLHGEILMDEGKVDEGLAVLALVVPRVARRGDFTSEIVNPRVWERRTAGLDGERLRRAQAWARGQRIEEVVEAILAGSDDRTLAH